jgi:hypothetical protein
MRLCRKGRGRRRREGRGGEGCRIRASHVKVSFARPEPALDPAGHDAGGSEGVMKD